MRKTVTSKTTLRHLAGQGINPDDVDFIQDYSVKYPTAKLYRNRVTQDKIAVITGKPRICPDGRMICREWEQRGSWWIAGANIVEVKVQGKRTIVTRDSEKADWHPELFIAGEPIDCTGPLVDSDESTLVWDYGVCRRVLRLGYGSVYEVWRFDEDPGGDVRIVSHRSGELQAASYYAHDAKRQPLEGFIGSAAEKYVPREAFENAEYPVKIDDTFTSSASDGIMYTDNAIYANARTAAVADHVVDDLTALEVESRLLTGTYRIYRSAVFFDTSIILVGDTVHSAELQLYQWSQRTDDAFDVAIREGQPAEPNDPLDAASFNIANYAGNYGSITPADLGGAEEDWQIFTVNDMLIVTKGGTTKWMLFCTNDIAGVAPTGNNWSFFSSAEEPGEEPKLIVVYAAAGDTITAFSSVSDGYLGGYSEFFAPAWEMATAYYAPTAGTDQIRVGTVFGSGYGYSVYRGFVFFDTSALGAGASLIGATISFYGSNAILSYNATDHLVLLSGMPTYPHDPLVQADYDKDFYTAMETRFALTDWSTAAYNSAVWQDADLSYINKTGTTKLCLRIQSEINGESPGQGHQFVDFWSAEEGEIGERRPRLLVAFKGTGEGIATITCMGTVFPRIIARPSLITATATVESTALRHTLHRETLTYTGTLEPGDSVAIGGEKIKATHWPASGGAVSVPQYLTGMPIDLLPGTNTLQYADDEAARTVGISIHHKPRYA